MWGTGQWIDAALRALDGASPESFVLVSLGIVTLGWLWSWWFSA